MNYDILITAFRSTGAKTVAARQLAAERNIPLAQALDMVERLPVPLYRHIDRSDFAEKLVFCKEAGIDIRIAESSGPPEQEGPLFTVSQEKPLEEEKPAARQPIDLDGGTRIFSEEPENTEAETRTVEKNATPYIIRLVAAWTLVLALLGGLGILLFHFVANGNAVKPGAGSLFSSADRHRELRFLDSASMSTESAIRFYRMVLRFNGRNVLAWRGLISACRTAGREEDALRAEAQMRAALSEETFSAERIVKAFGALVEFRRETDGSAELEYRPRKAITRDQVLRETFAMAHSLRRSGTALSFFATTDGLTGIVVSVNLSKSFGSLVEFEEAAKITKVGK